MIKAGRSIAQLITVWVLAIALGACGSSPWRYTPGAAEIPAGLLATAGNGQISLSWSKSSSAETYTVYYSDSPGVSAANGRVLAGIENETAVISNLDNGTRYYFAVAAVNSRGASPLSAEVSGIPSLPGPFQQADLQGTWRFNALVTGAGAKWLRGTIGVSATGAVSVASFLDSSGASAAPAGLFGPLTVLPDGSVFQAGAPAFHGVLAASLHKDLIVATTGAGGASPMMMILQKVVPGISFNASDIQGTGQAGAGPLPMVYHQLSSGAVSEWETASFQVGRDQRETYVGLEGPTARALPGGGGKVVSLSLTTDGIVTETPNAGVLPQPAALVTQGIMSADKMTIVGTATDGRGAYLLRVIHLVHPPTVSLTPASYVLADLAGSYGYHALSSGANPLWAYGTQTVGAAGLAQFSSYQDAGGSALPGSLTLTLDPQGLLADPGNPSFHGQFSYFKDMFVATRTDAAGVSTLSISLRGAN
jgi:hypothetical protein